MKQMEHEEWEKKVGELEQILKEIQPKIGKFMKKAEELLEATEEMIRAEADRSTLDVDYITELVLTHISIRNGIRGCKILHELADKGIQRFE